MAKKIEHAKIKGIWIVKPKIGKTRFREMTTPCTGCSACEVACSWFNEGLVAPQLARIKIIPKDKEWREGKRDAPFDQVICHQCPGLPPCIISCPVNALYRDEKTGAVMVNHERCTLCRSCEKACPYGAIHYSERLRKMLKCTLCKGNPKCVDFCPVGALEFIKIA